ncbi:MAG TPA: hypothetical protein VLE26_02355 [Alphaproteobacteria bacterium]|jgi:hypothetical protein|nr:hypothetical protein [Alphaproteobacteria bacterium]
MIMKKYAIAATFVGALLASPAFAQDAASCETMLSDFDSHLAANNIEATDERVTQARTDAEQACMSGDMTAAEASLDKAVVDLGIPPRTGKATGGDTGSTETGGASGSATTQSTDQSGAATGTTTDTQSGSSSTSTQ